MRRASLAILALTFLLGWAQEAAAAPGPYAWALEPPPYGPNSTAAADGTVLTLIGGGRVGADGTGRGSGTFEIADRAGSLVSAGTWTVSGPASVMDQGPLPEEVWENFIQRGIVTAHVSLEGVGEGTIKIYCAAGKAHLEGFRAKIGQVSYQKILTGANALMRSPA